MSKLRLLALVAVVALVLFPALALAAEPPPERPCKFFGTVTAEGVEAPAGTEVTAVIGNTTTSVTLPTVEYGSGWYFVLIDQPPGQAYEGKEVTFLVNGSLVEQKGQWTLGGILRLDLSLGEAQGPGDCVCRITGVEIGNVTGYNATTGKITLKQSDLPQGAKGDKGDQGIQGLKGEAGKDANMVMGIVAIVIAVIALFLAAVVMLRKKPA